MHVIEGECLVEDVIVDAVVSLINSCDGWYVRHWEELLVNC